MQERLPENIPVRIVVDSLVSIREHIPEFILMHLAETILVTTLEIM